MKTQKTGQYSVLMSVYFKEKPEYLRLSIQSILDQTVMPSEFILIKDGPLTEELDQVIEKFKINNPGFFKIIVNEKNLGLGPALNMGIKASANELIARMDSDDYSVPERCEKLLKKFEEDSSLDMVGSFEAEFIDDLDHVISVHRVPETDAEIRKFMRRRCALLHPTVMYKRSAVTACGGYHPVLLYEDYDLFARMVLENHVKSYNIQENIYYIRTSGDFFKRRGGMKYAKTVLNFKWNQFKKKNMSFFDFLISGLGQAFVCILPNKLRKEFYMKLLRK